MKENLLQKIRSGSVTFWGYRDVALPDMLLERGDKDKNVIVNARVRGSLSAIARDDADVCFLDREVISALLVSVPQSPGHILVRLAFRFDWLFGFWGLVRLLLKKKLSLRGVLPLRAGGRTAHWLVLERGKKKSKGDQLTLSPKVGVARLLDFLKEEKIQYVVLRAFNKLPKLGREGGDLDILVADEDESRVREFLSKNSGDIPVDLYSASGIAGGGLPYYPPPLARKILENAVDGSGESRVPAPKEAFLSLAYHMLYHKGAGALEKNIKELDDMARNLGVSMDITMESLDEYLAKEGWRPKRDTLAKIAMNNDWVFKRFFADSSSQKEIGLGVFILKHKALGLDLVDPIVQTIKKDGFAILYKEQFNEAKKKYAADHLRGGNWFAKSGVPEDFVPAMAIVALDRYQINWASDDVVNHGPAGRVYALKMKLRKKFGLTRQNSFVHGTDNSSEAWDYIDICFPDKRDLIEKKIKSFQQKNIFFIFKKLWLYLLLTPYLLRYKLRKHIVNSIVRR